MSDCKIHGHEILHRLWTKAVSTPDYVKEEWRELESAIRIPPGFAFLVPAALTQARGVYRHLIDSWEEIGEFLGPDVLKSQLAAIDMLEEMAKTMKGNNG